MYDNVDFLKKGSRNKLKIGQKVRAKARLVDWFTSHFCWSYGKKPKNSGYSEGEKEIDVEDIPKLFFWSWVKIKNRPLVGTIIHYGSDAGGKYRGRKCVWVDFKIKTEFGEIVEGTYVEEKDLELIGKKKK